MIIPAFVNIQFVEKNGYLTTSMLMYNDELNRVLRNGLSGNGWTLPQLSTAQITAIAPSMPNGTIWFDSTLKKAVIKTDSSPDVIEVIQSV